MKDGNTNLQIYKSIYAQGLGRFLGRWVMTFLPFCGVRTTPDKYRIII